MVVFQELVGGLWWLGAVLMAAGCILVGMREEKKDEAGAGTNPGTGVNEEEIRLTSDMESDDGDEVEADDSGRARRGGGGGAGDDDLLSFREN